MYGWGCQKGSSTSGWFALPGMQNASHLQAQHMHLQKFSCLLQAALLESPVTYGRVIPNQRLGSKGLHVFAHVVPLAWPDLQIATLTCWRVCSKQLLRLHGGHRDSKRF